MESYRGNYNESIARVLSNHGFGWHSETAMHILRLYASGLFDAYPKLKIIIGHMGEMLPFQLDRICGVSGQWARRNLKEVWDNNLWITTSGMFSLPPLSCLLQTTKIERVLYSVDYPFASNEKGVKFMEEIQGSGLVTEEQFEMIAYKNAEKLLGVKVVK